MPRILIFDKHGVYRSGLRCLIGETIASAEVIEAADCNEASSQIRTGCFDLVLVGSGRASLGPLDFLKKWREAAPTTRFAIISASNTRTDMLASLAAGFHGFISKHQPDTEILAAINDVLSGRIYVPSSVTEADDRNSLGGYCGSETTLAPSIDAHILKLTKRQREVLSLLARGLLNKEIARTLAIAEATTKIHLAALVRALGVRNRTEAAYKAGNLAILTELSSAEPLPGNRGPVSSMPELTDVG
jgi:DNA-binding NarL/FixJ family response regulator